MDIVLVGAEQGENLAVRYLWGALERAGHSVRHVTFNRAEDCERAARDVAASGAALAGFSMVFTQRARQFAALIARARELGFRGHTIAGGHFATFHADELLREVPALDSVGCGEGEGILCDLAARLDDPGSVPGLVWRAGDTLVRNPPAVKPPDLDTLAVPPRKRPADRYHQMGITNILGSRGCLHHCAFCSITAWHKACGGDALRLRSPECVADEMAGLYAQRIRIFNFHDDNFILPDVAATRRRIDALRGALEARGVGRIAFAIKARPDELDEGLFRALIDMGLFRVFLGIESGTAGSLRRLGRGQTMDDNVRALGLMERLDLQMCFNLLLLDPDSTLEDLAGHAAFLRAHPQFAMNFCRTEVYAGTPLERKLRREGRLRGDFWGHDYDRRPARPGGVRSDPPDVLPAELHERRAAPPRDGGGLRAPAAGALLRPSPGPEAPREGLPGASEPGLVRPPRRHRVCSRPGPRPERLTVCLAVRRRGHRPRRCVRGAARRRSVRTARRDPRRRARSEASPTTACQCKGRGARGVPGARLVSRSHPRLGRRAATGAAS
ncbi:MAG: cobalamin-dependent protein [Deltaproteobacteria bacterium]